MATEGGTPGGGGGARKNSPQDYLFGRIIGEGNPFDQNFQRLIDRFD